MYHKPPKAGTVSCGLRCLLTESRELDTIECINGGERPGLDLVHAQDDLEFTHSAHV